MPGYSTWTPTFPLTCDFMSRCSELGPGAWPYPCRWVPALLHLRDVAGLDADPGRQLRLGQPLPMPGLPESGPRVK